MTKHTETKKSRNKKVPSKYEDFVLSINKQSGIQKNKEQRSYRNAHKKARLHQLSIFQKKSKDSYRSSTTKIMDQLGIDNMNPQDYVSSILDKPELVSVKKVNLLTKMSGRGLFAEKNISEGTCLALYTGEEFTVDAHKEYLRTTPGAHNHYAMTIGRTVIDGITKGNFSRYINFSDSHANVEFVEATVQGKKVVKVIATENIEVGQQILVDYNTYEEQASKTFFFLNPSDGWQSSYEIYKENEEYYERFESPIALPIFNIERSEVFYLSEIARHIFDKKQLKNEIDMPDKACIDLPCLKANADNQIFDFDEADAFTPLMLACYLGQLSNVKWLLERRANVNQQQNHSGNCPLFLALEGYAAAKTTAKRNAYFNIIKLLIENNANLLIHDRADKIFLHKAITVLTLEEFKSIIFKLSTDDLETFKHMFAYIDDHGDDIVISALRNQELDIFRALLDAHPSYFDEYTKRTSKRNIDAFKDALEVYDEDDKANILELLSEDPINLSDELLTQLGFDLQEETQNSYGF